MARHLHTLTLTILNGETSAVLEGDEAFRAFSQSVAVSVYGPATLPETVTVTIAPSKAPAAGDYVAPGASTTVPAATAVQLPTAVFGALKLTAGGAVAADRAFKVVCQIEASLFAGLD